MLKLIVCAFTCLMLFSVASPQDTTDKNPTSEARRKLVETCLTPDRPKPSVEKERKAHELCGKAINLLKPEYPEEAKARGISGRVSIEVVSDEDGNVIWAKAVEGDPLLQQAALRAACQSIYSPERISNRAIKVARVITYNFLPK